MQQTRDEPTEAPRVTLDPDYPINGLVTAVIIQAVRDAAGGDLEARDWLAWDGLAWCEAVGINADEEIKQWIDGGCKRRKFPSKAHKSEGPKKPRGKSKKIASGSPRMSAA